MILPVSALPTRPPDLPALGTLSQWPQAVLQVLSPDDFAAWVGLRDEVIAGLAHPDMYVREADEAAFFARHLPPCGQCIGVFLDGELAAYAMVGMPGADDADNLGAVIGLPPASLSCVSHLASCMVRRPWRGHQLQRLLLQLRCALAQAYQRPLCLAMVSLHNPVSRHNLLANGMWIAWTGVIDGLRRHVLQSDLRGRQRWDPRDSRLIAGDDFDQLCAAAASGYVGVGEVLDGTRWMLRYARPLPRIQPDAQPDALADARTADPT